MTDMATKRAAASWFAQPGVVSVVVPAYNSARYLRETVASAAAEDIVREVIVVDDGSTDGTADLLNQLKIVTPKLRVLSQRNQGVSVARNAGFRVITTPFVCFLDADDLLLPGGLVGLHRLLVESRAASAAYGQVEYIDERSILLRSGRWRRSTRVVDLRGVLQTAFIDTTGALLIRTEAIAATHLFDPALRCAQDWEFYTRLVSSGPIVASKRSVVAYRQHMHSTMHAAQLSMHNFEPAIATVFSPIGPGAGVLDPPTLARYERRMRASILRRLGHRRQSPADHLRVLFALHRLLRESGYDRVILTLLARAVLTAGKRIILRA